ncbi:hypothetical protein EJB05_47767, partial [Eragrostis curvula]
MEEEQTQVEVPCYFLCPISLQMMRNPVTLPTGITYDRGGIERWLLAAGTQPTPNHTLLRLIQAWCALHPGVVDGVTTPKPPADRARLAALVSRLLDVEKRSPPRELLAALREIRDAAAEGERGRTLVAAAPGAVDSLFAVFVHASAKASEDDNAAAACSDEVLEIISSFKLTEQRLARTIETADDHRELVGAIVSVLRRPNAASRARAALLLEAVAAATSPASRLASLPEEAFVELVLLRDRVSRPVTKAALHVLAGAAAHGRNRVKAVGAGAVSALVEALVEDGGRRECELALGALGRLCGCAEGRAALVAHGAGVAAVASRALIGASEAATDAAVLEMAECGAVGALCVAAEQQSGGSGRTAERARETLRMHAGAWRSSPCLHPHHQAMYPC